jgi:hypothetical protein
MESWWCATEMPNFVLHGKLVRHKNSKFSAYGTFYWRMVI